ncbi:MAG: O-antigen ligase family protein [Chloroflexi bacterium]|nr:O-antigen ligase family protein [Chloroflexota bacterium]
MAMTWPARLDAVGAAGLAATVVALQYWRPWVLYRAEAPYVWDAYRTVSVGVADLVAFGTVLLVLGGRLAIRPGAGRAGASLQTGPIAFHLLMVVIVGSALAGAAGAPQPGIALAHAAHLLLAWCLALAAMNLRRAPGALAAALAGAVVVQGSVGALQLVTQSTFPAAVVSLPWPADLPAAQSGAPVVELADGRRWLRLLGTFPHPNLLAGYLLVAASALAARAWSTGRRSGSEKWGVIPSLAAAVLAVALLGLTLSRGALAGAIAGCGLLIALRLAAGPRRVSLLSAPPARVISRWALFGIISTVALVVIGTALYPLLSVRLGGSPSRLERQSVEQRLALLTTAWPLLARRPLLGVGAGNGVLAATTLVPLPPTFEPIHNGPLQAAVEAGPTAALAWLLLPVPVLAAAWRHRRLLRRDAAVLVSGVVALAVAGLSDHYLWSLPAGRLLWLVTLGIAMGALDATQRASEPPRRQDRQERGQNIACRLLRPPDKPHKSDINA